VSELTAEQSIEALRRYGWLRDDGDGERLHMTRPPRRSDVETRETNIVKPLAFPRTVYRTPGKTKGGHGVTYDGLVVKDQDAYDAALKEGWHPSVDHARGLVAASVVAPPADDRPTRAELEAEARRLGLSIHGNISDKRLAERILEAHKAKDAEANTPTE